MAAVVRRAMVLGAVGLGIVSMPASAGSYRDEQRWQLRSGSDMQVMLNREAHRGQANGSAGAGGVTGGGFGLLGTTVGNQVSGQTTYNVTVHGNNNNVKVDGYLNLDTNQHNQGQSSTVKQVQGK